MYFKFSGRRSRAREARRFWRRIDVVVMDSRVGAGNMVVMTPDQHSMALHFLLNRNLVLFEMHWANYATKIKPLTKIQNNHALPVRAEQTFIILCKQKKCITDDCLPKSKHEYPSLPRLLFDDPSRREARAIFEPK